MKLNFNLNYCLLAILIFVLLYCCLGNKNIYEGVVSGPGHYAVNGKFSPDTKICIPNGQKSYNNKPIKIQCYDEKNEKCVRYKGNKKSGCFPGGTTWEEANKICIDKGFSRLCSAEEANILGKDGGPIHSGCGFDSNHVWLNESCGQEPEPDPEPEADTEPEAPTDPGCYVLYPTGCNNKKKPNEWIRDSYGEDRKNAGKDENKCITTRKNDWNTFCSSEDTKMKFIPETTDDVPETTDDVPETTDDVPETTDDVPETTDDVPEPIEPGCWWKYDNDSGKCEKNSSIPSKTWLQDIWGMKNTLSGLSEEKCTSRINKLKSHCGDDSTITTHYVAGSPKPTPICHETDGNIMISCGTNKKTWPVGSDDLTTAKSKCMTAAKWGKLGVCTLQGFEDIKGFEDNPVDSVDTLDIDSNIVSGSVTGGNQTTNVELSGLGRLGGLEEVGETATIPPVEPLNSGNTDNKCGEGTFWDKIKQICLPQHPKDDNANDTTYESDSYNNIIDYKRSQYPTDDNFNYNNNSKTNLPFDKGSQYILKSQIVPPVCPACPAMTTNTNNKKCQPCPSCARCPEPAFDCKKVPNYNSNNTSFLPKPLLNDFSQF